VLLNMLHGTHYMDAFENLIPVNKVFGPWLVYLNNGSIDDATERYQKEVEAWPYSWFDNAAFQSRGAVVGRLILNSGEGASGAAVFLGDPGTTLTQGTTYQYTTTADEDGTFEFIDVRTEKAYTLQAWANGGPVLSGVTTVFQAPDNITVHDGKTTDLGNLVWKTQGRTGIWQIGDFDRKTLGFRFGGAPYQHALVDNCPANFTFTIGSSNLSEWCYGKSARGTWIVSFDVDSVPSGNPTSVLSLSIAGFSGSGTRVGGVGSALEIYVNGVNLGNHPDTIDTDPCMYRSGTYGGQWHYYEFSLDAGMVTEGLNEITFVTNVTAEQWRGVQWDMVKLEWS